MTAHGVVVVVEFARLFVTEKKTAENLCDYRNRGQGCSCEWKNCEVECEGPMAKRECYVAEDEDEFWYTVESVSEGASEDLKIGVQSAVESVDVISVSKGKGDCARFFVWVLNPRSSVL
ncbi:hypothetical protein GN958_ATG13485 [Phytophthora infestans]|uniref:Uncharacterized protein n=1 Tax=Phytophthora infestans TaxID=4787 RepID=A0A8S9U908_PHYIN|nr:hypothetical protein GN958_ATG13485 [Phytophthora infestans]